MPFGRRVLLFGGLLAIVFCNVSCAGAGGRRRPGDARACVAGGCREGRPVVATGSDIGMPGRPAADHEKDESDD